MSFTSSTEEYLAAHLLLLEYGPARLRAAVCTFQVNQNDEVPILVRHVLERFVPYNSLAISSNNGEAFASQLDEARLLTKDPSIVDEYMDGPKGLENLIDDTLSLRYGARSSDRLTSAYVCQLVVPKGRVGPLTSLDLIYDTLGSLQRYIIHCDPCASSSVKVSIPRTGISERA